MIWDLIIFVNEVEFCNCFCPKQGNLLEWIQMSGFSDVCLFEMHFHSAKKPLGHANLPAFSEPPREAGNIDLRSGSICSFAQ